MTAFILRRLVAVVPLSLLVATLVFSLIHLIPGDPVEMMLGDGAQRADIESLRHEMGLDRPLVEQYLRFMSGLARGDMGESIHFRKPVVDLLWQHYPATLQLAFVGMIVALLIAIPLGIFAALQRNRMLDHFARLISLLGVSMPNFWLGPMLILLFSIHFDLFPVSGRGGIRSFVLPAVTLGTALAGMLTRMIRSSVGEELHKAYLVTAMAKGLSLPWAVIKHTVKNAAMPVVTVIGLQFGSLLTGAIITETIFAWPGVGRLLIQGIRMRDYPLVQGGVLVMAMTYIMINLATDLVYAMLDPRVRPS